MRPGQKCNLGYHLVKTTPLAEGSQVSGGQPGGQSGGKSGEIGGDVSGGNKNSSAQDSGRTSESTGRNRSGRDSGGESPVTSVLDKEDFRNFLARAIKEEVSCVMSSLIETHLQRRKERSGI